jgi:hypothetical protein
MILKSELVEMYYRAKKYSAQYLDRKLWKLNEGLGW